MHTTNYYNAFIEIAEDSPVNEAVVPPLKKDGKTIAGLQYEMIIDHPYEYTSDDVVFTIYANRNNIGATARKAEREAFFSKGQPCFRTSALGKKYGWGVHSNADGKIALYPAGSEEYNKLAADKGLQHVKAMRAARK